MSKQDKKISRFLRSASLREDRHSDECLEGYVVTPSVRGALAKLHTAFQTGNFERTFSLTAPYGTGKSSFALFVVNLLQSSSNKAWQLLRAADAPLAQDCHESIWSKSEKPFAVLTVTGYRASVSCLLADALESVIDELPKEQYAQIEKLRTSRDTKFSLHIFTQCLEALCSNKFRGCMLIIDEFGKAFEHAYYSGKDTDINLLQELAELASRSVDSPFIFLGMLHQSFSDYAQAGSTLRNEFSKIEGRFEPIAFQESVTAQMQLIANASQEQSKALELDTLLKQARELKLSALVGLSPERLEAFAFASGSLHPLTLMALPYFFRRFGQNERSIFTFLGSHEAYSLLDFLSKTENEGKTYRLCDLYDYFFTNFEVQLSRNPLGRVFLEADDALSSKSSLTPCQRELLKTVAVLTSLGMQSPIHATEELIRYAMAPVVFTKDLGDLLRMSILVYRNFNRTYALWGGSDIDIDQCYKEADAELSKTGFSLAEILDKFMPPLPMVAKRHSIENGALRFFQTVYVDAPDNLEGTLKSLKSSAASGNLVVCLPEQEGWSETYLEEAKHITAADETLLFAVPFAISELATALIETRRLTWIEEHKPELRDDRIATREVVVRRAEATQRVMQYQFGLLDPQGEEGHRCLYVYGGEVQPVNSTRQVSELLSRICDKLYPQSPHILNELINKRFPSSQANAARNSLVKALNDPMKVSQERLGITGFPPEYSIYESVLKKSGMHSLKNGEWCLTAPSQESSLRPAWDRMCDIVFDEHPAPLPLPKLYETLGKRPYGVLSGLMPMLFCVFYLVHRDEVSLYQENTFLPVVQDAHFELLMRRPELFTVSGMRIQGLRKRIVERLAKGLKTDARLLPVVRLLYAQMNTLSKYARETSAVGEVTMKFRDAFFEARSPEQLLFVDLAHVLIGKKIDDDSCCDSDFEEYFRRLNACLKELANALPDMIGKYRALLLENCGFEVNEEGWRSLYDKCSFLLARSGGTSIGPFLQNVVNTAGDWNSAERVISYIQQTPMDKWGSSQLKEAKRNIRGVADRFKAACRQYDMVPTVLTPAEEAVAEKISRQISTDFLRKRQAEGTAVLKAALLKCLQELENGGEGNER